MILEIYSDKEKGVIDGSLLMYGAAPQHGREGAAPPPRCLISQRYSSLPSSYTDNKDRKTQTENTDGMKGKRETAEKHLLKALILFCDKSCANLENTPEKQENGSKMTRKRN